MVHGPPAGAVAVVRILYPLPAQEPVAARSIGAGLRRFAHRQCAWSGGTRSPLVGPLARARSCWKTGGHWGRPEQGDTMTIATNRPDFVAVKAKQQQTWASGDF